MQFTKSITILSKVNEIEATHIITRHRTGKLPLMEDLADTRPEKLICNITVNVTCFNTVPLTAY